MATSGDCLNALPTDRSRQGGSVGSTHGAIGGEPRGLPKRSRTGATCGLAAPTIPTSEHAHWTNASGSGTGALPNIPISALVIDRNFSDTVYVATDIGVFRTRDAGAHWELFSNGLPRVVVSGLLSGPLNGR